MDLLCTASPRAGHDVKQKHAAAFVSLCFYVRTWREGGRRKEERPSCPFRYLVTLPSFFLEISLLLVLSRICFQRRLEVAGQQAMPRERVGCVTGAQDCIAVLQSYTWKFSAWVSRYVFLPLYQSEAPFMLCLCPSASSPLTEKGRGRRRGRRREIVVHSESDTWICLACFFFQQADLHMCALACRCLFLCRVSCMEVLDLLISADYLSRLSLEAFWYAPLTTRDLPFYQHSVCLVCFFCPVRWVGERADRRNEARGL